MLKAVKVLGLVLLLSAISSVGNVAALNGEIHCLDYGDPFLFEFAVESYTKSTGALTLRVTITYCPETSLKANCDLLTLSVYPVGGLTYTGEDTLLIPYRDQNPYTALFEVTVPPNDTCALVFLWECGQARWDGQCFATTGDTLVTFRANPSHYGDLARERSLRKDEPYLQKDYERAKREWEAQQESLKHFKGKETTAPVMNPEDSALVDSLSDKGKRLLGKMRMMEDSPLTHNRRQTVEIEGRWFVRDSGETKFRRVEAKTDEQLRVDAQRYWDSLAANPPGNQYDVILDLRDPEHYGFAKSLLDSLIPADSVGFYRAVMDRPTLIKLISVLRNHPVHRNFWNDFSDSMWLHCENGEWGINSTRYNSANNYGKYCEGAVAGILWDIFDDVNDDYSTYSWLPPPPPNDSNPDGIMDSLSDGSDHILSILLNRYVNGHHPDNIDEFWQAWFTYPSPGHSQAMQDIWYEHGEIMHCCNHDGLRGDANGSGTINVADVAYLSAYLKQKPPGSPPPPCFEEGDVNGSGVINTADVTYLSAYLKQKPPGSPAPAACP
jgi:hypothetical protein